MRLNILTHTYKYIDKYCSHPYVYTYVSLTHKLIYIYIYVCVCVFINDGEDDDEEGATRKVNTRGEKKLLRERSRNKMRERR